MRRPDVIPQPRVYRSCNLQWSSGANLDPDHHHFKSWACFITLCVHEAKELCNEELPGGKNLSCFRTMHRVFQEMNS